MHIFDFVSFSFRAFQFFPLFYFIVLQNSIRPIISTYSSVTLNVLTSLGYACSCKSKALLSFIIFPIFIRIWNSRLSFFVQSWVLGQDFLDAYFDLGRSLYQNCAFSHLLILQHFQIPSHQSGLTLLKWWNAVFTPVKSFRRNLRCCTVFPIWCLFH